MNSRMTGLLAPVLLVTLLGGSAEASNWPAAMLDMGTPRGRALGNNPAIHCLTDPGEMVSNPGAVGAILDDSAVEGSPFVAFSGGTRWRQNLTSVFGTSEYAALAIRPGRRVPWLGDKLVLGLVRSQWASPPLQQVDARGVELGDFAMGDAVTGISAAVRVDEAIHLPVGRAYAGVLWSYITQGISEEIRGYGGSQGQTMSLGLLYTWINQTGFWQASAGLGVRNAPLKIRNWRVGQMKAGSWRYTLDQQTDLGLAVRAKGVRSALLVALGMSHREAWVITPALEARRGTEENAFVGRVGCRMRWSTRAGLWAVETDSPFNRMTLGFGIHLKAARYGRLRLDYGLLPSIGGRSIGHEHIFSVTVLR